jgi:HD-GYP domain-containing protein (c-di-GMP phosphodiesterase class II)
MEQLPRMAAEWDSENLAKRVTDLAAAIEAKDPCTSQHLARVALFAEAIAREMELSEEEIKEAHLAAVLHDLGKLWISDEVLKKQAHLTPEEWEHMKEHPRFGWQMLEGAPGLKKITEALLHHHERIDGAGYPLGLAGDEIPLLARIIAVADTFDAITSDRPYRKAHSAEQAHDEIVRHRGTQFCEKVVDAFARAFSMDRMGIVHARGQPMGQQ